MRVCRAAILVLAGMAAGCSSAPVPRPLAPPPRAEMAPVTRPARTSRTDEAATERFLDAQIGGVGAESEAMPAAGGTSVDAYRQRPQRRVTNEAATELFLDHEIERRRYVPPVRTEPVVEQRTVYVEPRVTYVGRRPTLPWATLFGASVGAVVGDASGHSGRGAAIGAGMGLLLDLSRTR